MDRIAPQIRTEHYAIFLNECINRVINKTAWCRANGFSHKHLFYWWRILRREAFESSQNTDHPVVSKRALRLATEYVSFAEVNFRQLKDSPKCLSFRM